MIQRMGQKWYKRVNNYPLREQEEEQSSLIRLGHMEAHHNHYQRCRLGHTVSEDLYVEYQVEEMRSEPD